MKMAIDCVMSETQRGMAVGGVQATGLQRIGLDPVATLSAVTLRVPIVLAFRASCLTATHFNFRCLKSTK